jgi:tRNA threonylcarbamoyladenosine biosynthesis protein TsaB
MIDEVLSKSSLTLDNLDYIAFTAGPGSFTGIRIGFGIVQGLAYGANIPVLPVSSLETLAYTAIRKLKIKEDLNIIPMIDARMNEIYWAKFSYKSGILSRDSEDCVSSPQCLKDSTELPVILIGNVIDCNNQVSENTLDFEHIVMLPEAQDILNIAQLQLKTGQGVDIHTVSPIYLRNNIKWKKRKKLRKT